MALGDAPSRRRNRNEIFVPPKGSPSPAVRCRNKRSAELKSRAGSRRRFACPTVSVRGQNVETSTAKIRNGAAARTRRRGVTYAGGQIADESSPPRESCVFFVLLFFFFLSFFHARTDVAVTARLREFDTLTAWP